MPTETSDVRAVRLPACSGGTRSQYTVTDVPVLFCCVLFCSVVQIPYCISYLHRRRYGRLQAAPHI